MAEKRLIDANDVYSLFDKSGFARLHVADIDTIPRVDAVEVVRCRECKSYDEECGYCESMGFTCKFDDFCSYGEKRINGKAD